MQRYFHPIYGIVTLRSEFSSHCNVETGSGLRPVQRRDLTPYIDGMAETQSSVNSQPESTDLKTIAETGSELKPEKPPEEAEQLKINLNNTPVHLMAKQLPIIGVKKARQIVTNRPSNGYKSFEHFRQLNPTICETDEAWAKIEAMTTV